MVKLKKDGQMGDGRYYTSNQFFSIIFYTILIIYIVVSFMLFLYKVSPAKKLLLFTQSSLGLSLLFGFTEEIILKSPQIELFHNLSIVFLYLTILLYACFYLKEFINKSINRHILISMLLYYFLPAMLWMVFEFNNNLLYLILAFNFNILTLHLMPYRISSSIFRDVKELVLDYVFIINVSGDIVYKSDRVLYSNIFKDIHHLNIEHLDCIFTKPIKTRQNYGKQFIEFSDDKNMYFQFVKKKIIDNDLIVGHIITFADITDLIVLLDELKERQVESVRINSELLRYKEIVYDIEKEKEITLLLEEIANNQHRKMVELRNKIIATKDFQGSDFPDSISSLIFTAKEDLTYVRQSVTTYMNHYKK